MLALLPNSSTVTDNQMEGEPVYERTVAHFGS